MSTSVEIRQGVAVILMDSPPVNSLGHALRASLARTLDEAIQNPEVQAIVLAGDGKMFSGGAAIDEFNQPVRAEPSLRSILRSMESSGKPIAAAIHGHALGGGLELALGCHYRLATADAKLALPEVTLGLLPGGGGTQRGPRLMELGPTLELMLTGKRISGKEARDLGLIDDVIQGDLIASSVEWLLNSLPRGMPLPVSGRAPKRPSEGSFSDVVGAVLAKLKIQRVSNAAAECIACVEAAFQLPFEEGLDFERARFLELVASTESRSLRHIFFAERQAARIPGHSKHSNAPSAQRIGVVGAGFMGSGIAMSFANAGLPVQLLDQSVESVEKGIARIRRTFGDRVAKGKLSQTQADERLCLIQPIHSYDELDNIDLLVEAVFEDMDAKKAVFAAASAVCGPNTILATNTSRLNIDEIAAVTQHPENVLGMHFFSPAHVMRLVEIVRAPQTSERVLAATMATAKAIGKIPVAVGMCDGFVGNRMVAVYLREAGFLLEEGAEPAQVDRALGDFGMAMGPIAMMDMVGLDIMWAARKRTAAQRPPNLRYSKVADALCERGRFGQKTGAGYYRYEAGSRTPLPDPVVVEIIEQCAAEAGIVRRKISDEEIVERTIYALVNEGQKILTEGIASRASDIDVIYVNGYGFPKWRGGPMFYAETVGLEKVYEKIRQFHRDHGAYWEPAA